MNKIGLLLPRSSFYNTIGFDLFEGLKSGLKKIGRDDIKLVTENIGFGTDKQQCYRSAEKLLLEEDVDLIIASKTQDSESIRQTLQSLRV